VYIQLDHRDQWVFVDEIGFDSGRSAAPEPGALALFGIGVVGGALVRRRRSRRSSRWNQVRAKRHIVTSSTLRIVGRLYTFRGAPQPFRLTL
jgi:hypothetical protein